MPFIRLLTVSLAAAAVMAAPASASPHPRPNAVTAWNVSAAKAALAACIAPADNPRVSVTVFLERGGGPSDALPLAMEVLKQYFALHP